MASKPNMRMGGVDTSGNAGVMASINTAGRIEADANKTSALAGLGQGIGEWADTNLKEQRQIALEKRSETRQIAKEGRATQAAGDERDRISLDQEEAWNAHQQGDYSTQAARDMRDKEASGELDAKKVESEIAKNKAAAGKYGAEADYARSGKGKTGSGTIKFTELDDRKLKDIDTALEIAGSDEEIKRLNKIKQGIYLKYDPEAQEKLARQQELLRRQGNEGGGVLGGDNKPTAKREPTVYEELKELKKLEAQLKPDSPTLGPQEYKKIRERIAAIKDKYNK